MTWRYSCTGFLFWSAWLTLSVSAVGDEPSVPLSLQVDLTSKVIRYAQQPSVRAVDAVHVGILVKAGNAESTRVGNEVKSAFDKLPGIAGQPHDQTLLKWSSAADLVEDARSRKLFLIYLTPGLASEVPTIARALTGVQVLTISSTDDYVSAGIILGFELVSGHPKMVFNLSQAKRQSVVFGSAVMKLMRVVE